MEQTQDAIRVILDNLLTVDEQIVRLYECRLAHIREEAAHAATGYSEQEDVFFLRDAFRGDYAELMAHPRAAGGADTPLESQADLSLLCARMRNAEAIYFCRTLLAHFRASHGKRLQAEDFCPYEEPQDLEMHTERIAYLKNPHSDLAYQQFCRILPKAPVSYCDDFQQVCEAVSNGRARYGILPFASSADGRLKSFRNLLNRFDLKIVLTCEVQGSDGNFTVFALFGRRIVALDCGRYRAASYFECSISTDAAQELPAILEAAAYFGLRLQQIDTVLTVQGAGASFDMVFTQDSADLCAFLCYLSLEHPRYLPLGVYTCLRKE